MRRQKKDTRRELVSAFECAEAVRLAESARETDIMTGFAIGVVCQKVDDKKLSKKTGETIARMIEAVGNSHRKRFKGQQYEKQAEIDTDLDLEALEDYLTDQING